ncbi:MAG: LysR family transcriptional regulator [Bacillota bacterium]|nr:LysR family transcriptional regulator [Bacillota bacterium]
MTITQLRYFVEAARLQSFTKAAEQFYITQTAMTQQIRALEETVGASLFNRSTRPISLTSAGKTFLIDARAILERMEVSLEHIKEASTGMEGNLRIGYVRGYERSNLSNLLQSFHRQYPNVLLSVYRNSTDSLANSLSNQELDIIVTWDSTNLCSNPQYDSFHMTSARLVVALYPSHPLAGRKSLFRKELKDERILYMSPSDSPDSYGDAVFMNLYQKAQFKPDIIFRSSDTESILIMVAAEEGVSILPDYCTNKLTNADNLVFIPLEGEEEVEEIKVIWNNYNTNPILPRLVEHLKKENS